MRFPYRLTPHAHLSFNPLFDVEARRVQGGSARSLVRYGRWSLLLVCGGAVALWTLLDLLGWQDGSILLTILLFGLSLLATFLLDTYCIASALGSIRDDVSAGRWELLHLTNLSDAQIIAAKTGIAQLRAWRLMFLMIALRLAVVLLAVMTGFLLLYRARPLNLFVAIDIVFLALGFGWVALLLSALYVVEPYWRMGALTALGVAISARTHQYALSILLAVAAIVTFWLVQGIAALLFVAGIVALLSPMLRLNQVNNQSALYLALFFLALLVPLVYGFYNLLQNWSLRSAERWIANIS